VHASGTYISRHALNTLHESDTLEHEFESIHAQ